MLLPIFLFLLAMGMMILSLYCFAGDNVYGGSSLMFVAGMFLVVVIPEVVPITLVKSTEIEHADINVLHNPSSINNGISFGDHHLKPIDYAGRKAFEKGNFKLYEQDFKGDYFISRQYRYLKAFDLEGHLISEKFISHK